MALAKPSPTPANSVGLPEAGPRDPAGTYPSFLWEGTSGKGLVGRECSSCAEANGLKQDRGEVHAVLEGLQCTDWLT